MGQVYLLEEVSLELSNRCAGRCIHCSSMAGDPDPDELDFYDWLRIIKEAYQLKASVISLSGGDPLLADSWVGLVDRIASLGMGVLFYTSGIKSSENVTFDYDKYLKGRWKGGHSAVVGRSRWSHVVGRNGRIMGVLKDYIDEEDLKCLKKAFSISWGKIIFSLEGDNAETHDDIVGVKGTFDMLVNHAIPTAIKMGLDVELHFTPMKSNFRELIGFLQLARSLGVSKVSFLRLVPQGRAAVNVDDVILTPFQFTAVQQVLYSWVGEPSFRIGCPLSFGHLFGYIEERPRCHAGKDLLLVRPDGDVHCCAGWKECKSLVLGNVKGQTLAGIWDGNPVLDMIRKFNKDDGALGYCRSCPWKPYCGGGCPAQRVIFNQQKGITNQWDQLMHGVDPMCLRYNGLISDDEIRNARQRRASERRRQDDHGNVVQE